MDLHALTWNLFHGRDFPPDPELLTWRSRLLRIRERNATHIQVNRDLRDEFCTVLAAARWDVALLQECPPRWSSALATACGADVHRVLTSRNSLPALRGAIARLNPDLIAAGEGGSNLIMVRRRAGEIVERRALVLQPGPNPERRTMALARAALGSTEVWVANLHASAGAARRALAEREVMLAAETAVEAAGTTPLIFGGDLNLRPAQTGIYGQLAERLALRGTTSPDALDHLLVRGLEIAAPPRPWAAERREVDEGDLAIRLSDHAPVAACFVA